MTTIAPSKVHRLAQSVKDHRAESPKGNHEVLQTALEGLRAGLCIIPTSRTRHKVPQAERVTPASLAALGLNEEQIRESMKGDGESHNGWTHYRYHRASEDHLRRWYTDQRLTGLGVILGNISGGAEALEFDSPMGFDAFRGAAIVKGLAPLIDRIAEGYLSESPSGGHHMLYRCSVVEASQKLAGRLKLPEEMKDENDKYKVLIETRGEGGWIVEAPSFGRVHPTGRPYVIVHGRFLSIVTISPEERALLLGHARSFDQMLKESASPPKAFQSFPSGESGTSTPWGDFNERGTWIDVIGSAGWKIVRDTGSKIEWLRPGKHEDGISATTGYTGGRYRGDCLWVFSEATAFKAKRSYTKFQAYSLLYHNGDNRAATLALMERGFGKRRARPIEEEVEVFEEPENAPVGAAGALPDPSPPPVAEDDAPPITDECMEDHSGLKPATAAGNEQAMLNSCAGILWQSQAADKRELRGKTDFGTYGEEYIVPNSKYILLNRYNALSGEELLDVLRDCVGWATLYERLKRCGIWSALACRNHGIRRRWRKCCSYRDHTLDDGKPHWTTTQRRLARMDVPDPDGQQVYVSVLVTRQVFYRHFAALSDAFTTLIDEGVRATTTLNKDERYAGRIMSRATSFAAGQTELRVFFQVGARLNSEQEREAFIKAVTESFPGRLMESRIFRRGYQFQQQVIFDSQAGLIYVDRRMGQDRVRDIYQAYLDATKGKRLFQTLGEMRRIQAATPKPEKKKQLCDICGEEMIVMRDAGPPPDQKRVVAPPIKPLTTPPKPRQAALI